VAELNAMKACRGIGDKFPRTLIIWIPSKLAQVLMLLADIWKVPGLNIGWDTDSAKVFVIFLIPSQLHMISSTLITGLPTILHYII
jgi:hypothetical protein